MHARNVLFVIVTEGKEGQPQPRLKWERKSGLCSCGFLATAVWDLQALFDLTGRVHQTPLIFPVFILGVVLDLPGLVKGLEPN